MEKNTTDILWIIIASGLVFLMQAGFALLETGLTRSKNNINVAIKNLTDLGVSIILYWAFGFAIMFGASFSGLVGTSHFFTSIDNKLWLAAFFLFQTMFCSTSATIVSGAVAERMKYSSYIVCTVILSALIYPVYGHWAWGGFLKGDAAGWLEKSGFIDFAGSTVVHSVGGWIALAALLVIGPRAGRFSNKEMKFKIQGSNIPSAVVGVIILWFGWFGFNGGSTLTMSADVVYIIVKTTLSTAGGMVASIFIGWFFYKLPDVRFAINGAVAGLVAITACCHVVSIEHSVLIGAVGAIIALGTGELLEKLKIDDAVEAIPVHLAAGIWGTLSVALFGKPELINNGLTFLEQLKIQTLGIVTCGLWSFTISYLLFKIINKFWKLRVSPKDEQDGLNIAEHGASTELYDLYNVMEQHSRTGDLSLRVPEEPFTEVGQIAGRYNHLMDSLEKNTVARSEYLSIFNNVTDGLFLIDSSFSIGDYYSNALEQILNKKGLAKQNFLSIISSIVPEEKHESIKDFLELLFNEKINYRAVTKLNPLTEIEVYIDSGNSDFETRHLKFYFKRVIEKEKVIRLMIIIRDVTERVKLEHDIEKTKKNTTLEMELFYKIIHIEPKIFQEFLLSSQEELNKINETLESSEDNQAKLQKIFRAAHAIKGDSNILGLDFIGEKSHELEEKVADLQSNIGLNNSDFISLAIQFSELQKTLTKSEELLNKLIAFQNKFLDSNISPGELLVLSIEKLIERLSKEMGKKVSLISKNFKSSHIPEGIRKKIKDILIQLTRNSLYHGIEEPVERRCKGKDEYGEIEISTVVDKGNLSIIYKDDGQGLNLKSLAGKGVKSGKWTEEEAANMSKKELVKLIFQQGVSTAEKANLVAGRGIGMDLVKNLVKELNGKIKLNTIDDRLFEFHVMIPDNLAV